MSKQSVVGQTFFVLSFSDRRKLIFIVLFQVLFGFLDFIGVALVGIIGALSVSGVQSEMASGKILEILEFLRLSEFSFQSQVAILSTMATFLLVFRTLLSVHFSRKIIFFLSRRSAVITSELISRWLSQPLIQLQNVSTQEAVYSLTRGVQMLLIGVLATFLNFLTDVSLLIILFAGLFIVDPTISILTLTLFFLISFAIFKSTSQRSVDLGIKSASLIIQANTKLIEAHQVFREAFVRNRRDYYARQVSLLIDESAEISGEIQFLPNISKYVIESSIIVGALLISGTQFLLNDASHAFGTLAVFMAAGTRLAPAVMRIQQSLIHIKSNIGSAHPTLNIIQKLDSSTSLTRVSDVITTSYDGFTPEIEVSSLYWTFPGSLESTLSDVSFAIQPGEAFAIVGPSGAGKSSLLDSILGVLPVRHESVRISSVCPKDAITKWPGAIGYVPQDIQISEGTIRQNVCIGFPDTVASDDQIWNALEVAQLSDFVSSLPSGLDTQVGERGIRMSGGQRQRLGIARAMFTNPKLLVLDEATNSLDGQTESDFSTALQKLKNSVTIVIVSHKLSTIRLADRIAYLEKGRILAIGDFNKVCAEVPNFKSQILNSFP